MVDFFFLRLCLFNERWVRRYFVSFTDAFGRIILAFSSCNRLNRLPQITGKIAYNIEVEQDKGMIYSAGINYEFAKDYNRNINVSVGVGYKF